MVHLKMLSGGFKNDLLALEELWHTTKAFRPMLEMATP